MKVKQGEVLKTVDRGKRCFVLVMELLRNNTARVFCLTPCESFSVGSVGYVFEDSYDMFVKSSYKEFLDYQKKMALEKHITPQTTQIKKGLEDMANEALKEQRRKEIEEIVDQRLHERGFGLSLEERLKLFYTKFAKPLGGNDDEE